MARRSTLTTEDLNIIERALTSEIATAIAKDAQSAEAVIIDAAPLFAVREKVIAMRAKPNGPSVQTKTRKARGSRTVQEITEA